MDRDTIITRVRTYLGTASDDPAYTNAILEPIVQEAADGLVMDINLQNPGMNSKTVTLKADSASSHLYTFSTQTAAITDFGSWLEVRWTDSSGLELHEVRYEELRWAGQDHFFIAGLDDVPILETSADSGAGTDIFFRYSPFFADMTVGTNVPAGIPLKFHDVIALEMLYVFGLGGEADLPPALFRRWETRRGQLIHHVGKRGTQPSRSRVYTDSFD